MDYKDCNEILVTKDHPCFQQIVQLLNKQEIEARNKIVAFIGRAGSGKDYQCNLLEEQGYHKMAFADALRDIAFTTLNIQDRSPEHYDELKSHDCIQVADSFYDGIGGGNLDSTTPTGHYLNFRKFLELLGTQGIRKYDNDFWCRCLITTLEKEQYKKVCISDMRFTNEYFHVKHWAEEHNYDFKCIFCDYHSDRYQENNNHDSARMGNYFATHGYTDLQEISYQDMEAYLEYMNCGIGKYIQCGKVTV